MKLRFPILILTVLGSCLIFGCKKWKKIKVQVVDIETGEVDIYENFKSKEIIHGSPFQIEIYQGKKKSKIKVQRSILNEKIVLPPLRHRSDNSKKYRKLNPK